MNNHFKEVLMKNFLLSWICFSLLIFALGGVSYGWQGRMGGMEDPYGLVADESDFLIHPAKIANGQGVKFYGNYRFTYTGVSDWDHKVSEYDTTGVLQDILTWTFSGDEYRHNALLGSAFPLGPGRMGFFFTYDGMRGSYDGDYSSGIPPSYFETHTMDSDLDNFAFRLLYGLPIGGFKLGGEVQFAYRQEENKLYILAPLPEAFLNFYDFYYAAFLPPYDSRYWEALLKGSLEGKVGPLDLEFTLRGGFDFAGANEWAYEHQIPPGTLNEGWDLEGDVQGWRIGGDLWARYPLGDGITLPVLVRVDYQTKTRDGDGPGVGTFSGNSYDYEHERRDLAITVGGGLDKAFDTETRIAAGVYYNYLQGRDDFLLHEYWPRGIQTRDTTYPDWTEHQILIRLAGEHAFSPVVSLRGGFSFFYGLRNWDREYNYTPAIATWFNNNVSGNGFHWGFGGSLGGTIRVKPITLEPFVNGGYQQLKLDGDGTYADNTGITRLTEEKETRNEWFIGGGLSILYDL
jgi:hypothetical protein